MELESSSFGNNFSKKFKRSIKRESEQIKKYFQLNKENVFLISIAIITLIILIFY